MKAINKAMLAQWKTLIATAIAYLQADDYLLAKPVLLESMDIGKRLADQSSENAMKALYLKELDRLNKLVQLCDEQTVATTKETHVPKPVIKEKFQPIQSTTTFADVVGMDNVKQALLQRMKLPLDHVELAKKWGVATGGGILLYGPPGTGKTYIAKAAAGELDIPFIAIQASDLMSKWVGDAEKNIAELFGIARSYERCIVFIDEIEALLPKRKKNNSSIMSRVVPQFLSETDGVKETSGNLLLMGATNHPWMIDEAMLRGGRFDSLIYIGLADFETRKQLFMKQLKGKPTDADVDYDKLSELGDGLSAADIRAWGEEISRVGFNKCLNDINYVLIYNELLESVANMRRSVSSATLGMFRAF